MKKLLIVAVLMLMVCAIGVNAGSVEDLDYKDSTLLWTNYRQIDDNNVVVDADTLEGSSLSDIESVMDEKDNETMSYIKSNEAQYLSDGGVSFGYVEKYLFNEYLENTMKVCKVNEYEMRISQLELELDNLYAIVLGVTVDDYQKARAIELANKNGVGTFRAYTCYDYGVCLKTIE